jgi:hypothetical protein
MQIIVNVWNEIVQLCCRKITFIVKFIKFLNIFLTTLLKRLSCFEHIMSILCCGALDLGLFHTLPLI